MESCVESSAGGLDATGECSHTRQGHNACLLWPCWGSSALHARVWLRRAAERPRRAKQLAGHGGPLQARGSCGKGDRNRGGAAAVRRPCD
eukprot:3498618-Pleurochrysis_carterae.AAC.1